MAMPIQINGGMRMNRSSRRRSARQSRKIEPLPLRIEFPQQKRGAAFLTDNRDVGQAI
jgi:hypothetical protein